MNKDIEIMIKLQNHWLEVINSTAAAERFKKDIRNLLKKLEESEKKYAEFSKLVLKNRQEIKNKEAALLELEQKIKKLNERKNLFKTQREVEASESELNEIKRESGVLEGELISLMDALSEDEKSLGSMAKETEDQRHDAAKSVEKLSADIKINEETAALSKEKYAALLEALDAAYKLRFDKLLKSKGKAVGEVQDEVCGVCNFKIPSHLASEAMRGYRVVNCTNCGSYIYRLS